MAAKGRHGRLQGGIIVADTSDAECRTYNSHIRDAWHIWHACDESRHGPERAEPSATKPARDPKPRLCMDGAGGADFCRFPRSGSPIPFESGAALPPDSGGHVSGPPSKRKLPRTTRLHSSPLHMRPRCRPRLLPTRLCWHGRCSPLAHRSPGSDGSSTCMSALRFCFSCSAATRAFAFVHMWVASVGALVRAVA